MPTDLENAKLMFLCLQFSTATAFDYKKIGEECGVSAGAASKRMSRLKQAVKEGKESGLDVRYLWSCIQNSDMNNVDFKAVGQELGLNSGAASKRWSRLKQALERGETGSTASASGAAGAKQGGAGSNKKGAAGGKKRQNTETPDDEESGNASVKKAKRNPSTTRKVKAERKDDSESDTIDGESDTFDGSKKKAITTDKKPAPSREKAATVGPKKKSSTAATPQVNSAPPALNRRRRPLTDEEIYKKLNVEEAEELEKRSMGPHRNAYPSHHNLTETFQAVRTPDGKKTAATAIFDDIDIPGENNDSAFDGDDGSWYPTPKDSGGNSASPSKQKKNNSNSNKRTTTTVQDVFTAIAEDVMKSPSAAEQRLLKQQKVKEDSDGGGIANQHSPTKNNNGWFHVPQNLPNPFVVIDAPLARRADYASFFSDDDIGDDEEYV